MIFTRKDGPCDTVSDPHLAFRLRPRIAHQPDPTRLRILDVLLDRDDITVTELAGAVGEAAPNVSQHLSRLLAADIVGRRRDGRTVRYSVADPTIRPLCDLVCKALSARGQA